MKGTETLTKYNKSQLLSREKYRGDQIIEHETTINARINGEDERNVVKCSRAENK